jgi:hypothetical protein
MSVGSPKYVPGFPDIFGGKMFNTIDYSGPTAYNNTGTPATSGDSVSHRMFGFENTVETYIGESVDQSGTYFVIAQPVNNGVTAWKLRWFTLSGSTEVANGVNLSGFTVKLSAIGF